MRLLYSFMAPRHFVAGRSELTSAGFTPSRIDTWVRIGRLIKLFRGVYAYGRDVETSSSARRAALTVAGSGAALVGRSACEVWGMVTPKRGMPCLIEVGIGTGEARLLRGRSPALRGTTVKVVTREFQTGDIRMKDGLSLTSPSLALIDLAGAASDREVRFAFLEACRLGLFDEGDVKACFDRLVHRRGATKLRLCLALWVPELRRVRSVFEGWFLMACVEGGCVIPKVNVRVAGYEVDAYWPEHGIVLELDGAAFHAGPVQKKLDLRKQRTLEARGLAVIRLTFKEFEADPEGSVERIIERLRG